MLETLVLKRIEADTILKPFHCGCPDLNDYFQNDAVSHLKELMAVTYVFETKLQTVAFFSVANDRISREDAIIGDNNPRSFFRSILHKLRQRIPERKRYRSIPAVKIGRLGVNADYQGTGIGTEILDFIKVWFTNGNKTGCRCVTVDAYNTGKVLNFYKKNGFEFLNAEQDEADRDTRLMFFDLMLFVNSKE